MNTLFELPPPKQIRLRKVRGLYVYSVDNIHRVNTSFLEEGIKDFWNMPLKKRKTLLRQLAYVERFLQEWEDKWTH